MDNRMLALWSTPRSTSAAIESMMHQRGDFRCLRVPFALPYYRGADRRTTRFDAGTQDMSITYASTWGDLEREHRKGRVFFYDHPNYILHMVDDAFIDEVQNTFLIQHPASVLPAMYETWSTFTLDECAYPAMHQLFEAVAERTGTTPTVIDVADLVTDPYRTVEEYCKHIGIPFLPETLDSEALADYEPQPPSTDIDDVPFLTDMLGRCLPHYEALARFKL